MTSSKNPGRSFMAASARSADVTAITLACAGSLTTLTYSAKSLHTTGAPQPSAIIDVSVSQHISASNSMYSHRSW